ncbi:RCC1 and BTB domain-containing protein 1-like isoform X1 [Eriocheir sinensis]|uniref:RCC1 and BTB domain-containing protein 1-like isoform X1 n=1 Tax=Eriocheir sinensis TaxID=95602 RepID=UPI0021C64F0A|nr:RCC1 and BTB domain-containing protein 1-like isoform X1 [Eriocheir sinensis]
MELEKWPIFSLLKPEFVEKMKLACVFGNMGNEAIIVTKDDDVYALGFNGAGCLGVGDQNSTMEPRKIEPLCQKKVKGIAYGSGPHVLAYTESGELYSWGHNGYCQLGNGSTNQGLTPYLVTTHLHNKRVTGIAAGSHHSLALTEEGEVLAWGQNNYGQVGSGTTTNQPTPRRVIASIGGRQVVDIACGQTSSMAVMDNGEVYGWGLNSSGQLGLGNNVNQHNPSRVTALQGVVITKIVCGYSHTLALSDEGSLWAWGANSYGQLGTGNKANQCAPVRVAQELGRIVDIASSHCCHLSAAMTQNSKIYFWGHCKGQSVVAPMETGFSSLHEVFALWASPSVTFEPLNVTAFTRSSLAQAMSLALDDEETADVVFVVDDRRIRVHRAVLKIRCQYFRNMFQEHWKENNLEEVEVKDYSFVVFRAFLQYIYTDTVIVSPEDAIGLLDLANAYCEEALKRHCERIIRHGITTENAAMLYAVAIKYEATELEEFCFRFALNHMTEVAQTEAFMALDELTVKNFIQRAAQHGAFKY